MGTDQITEAEGSGGLADVTDPEAGTPDPLMTPQGETVDAPDDKPGPIVGVDPDDEGDDDAADDWTADLPEDLREVAGKYRSPADLARAYDEAQRRLGEQGNDIGQLRAALAERYGDGGDDGGQRDDGEAPPTYEMVMSALPNVAKRVDDGELEPGAALQMTAAAMIEVMQRREDALLAHVEQMQQEAVAPVAYQQQRDGVARAVNTMREELGEDYDAFKGRAAEVMTEWTEADPSFVANPQAVRTAFTFAIAEKAQQQRRSKAARTLDNSGPGPGVRKVDAAKMILDQMDGTITGGGLGGGL